MPVFKKKSKKLTFGDIVFLFFSIPRHIVQCTPCNCTCSGLLYYVHCTTPCIFVQFSLLFRIRMSTAPSMHVLRCITSRLPGLIAEAWSLCTLCSTAVHILHLQGGYTTKGGFKKGNCVYGVIL